MTPPSGMLIGNRRCIECGYRLSGQPIVADDVYNIYIVRCAECGTVAGLRDRPFLGRVARLLPKIMAAGWGLLLIASLAATVASLFGLTFALVIACCDSYTNVIRTQYYRDNEAAGRRLVFEDWWAGQDQAAFLGAAGGLHALAEVGFVVLIPLVIVSAVWGCFWNLWHATLRGWGRVAWVLLVLVSLASLLYQLVVPPEVTTWADEAAAHQIGHPVVYLALAIISVVFTLTFLCARPVLRLLLKLTIPGRFRRGLLPLWMGHPAAARDLQIGAPRVNWPIQQTPPAQPPHPIGHPSAPHT